MISYDVGMKNKKIIKKISTKLPEGSISKNEVGSNGEKVAEVYFKKRGHKILDKNYRKLRGEIDLITLKDNTIHFVEVKTTLHDSLQNPLPINQSFNRENLHDKKIKQVVKISEMYRIDKKIAETIESQIDGLLVDIIYDDKDSKSVKVQYIPNVNRIF